MAQQARDEAGNIWNIDEQGNPVSLAQAAGASVDAGVVAPNPFQVERQRLDAANAALSGQRTAQQIAQDAATAPVDQQKRALDVESTRLANEKSRRDLAAPPKEQQEITDRMSRLMQLAQQVGRTQALYRSGIGTTKGIAGVQDYLPTDTNARFDVAGASLSQQGLAAFRVPGTGTVSDRDAMMFDRANLPTASTRDVAVEEQLRSIRSRVDEEMKALGRPALDWAAIERRQAGDGAASDGTAATVVAGGGGGTTNPPKPPTSGPAGYDVAGVAGGVSGGPGGGGAGFANAAGVAMATKLKDAYNQGAGVSQLNEILRDNGFQEFTDAQAIAQIQKRGPLNFAPPAVDDTRGGVGRALGTVAESDALGGLGGDVAAYAMNAGNAVTGNNLDMIAGDGANLAIDYASQRSPIASTLGTIGGSVVGSGAAELGLGAAAARYGLQASPWIARTADTLYGAATGAGSADGYGESRLGGAVAGGLGGLGGGIAGRAAARGIGGALRGVQNADVRGLRDAGINNMTVGQALSQSGPIGAGIKRAEDLVTGIPGPGTVVNARRTESLQDLNRVAFDQGLSPIGRSTNGVVQEEGIDLAQGLTRGGYRTALDGVNVVPEPQFRGEYDSAVSTGSAVPRVGPEFQAWAQADLDPLVNQPSFSGDTIQDFIQQTRKADFGADAMGNLVGRSVTGAENAMRGLVGRQAPDALPKLSKADEAFRNVEILRDAVNRARNGTQSGETGLFVASQLSDSVAANAKKYGNSHGTTRQPFFDLTRAAQKVLPSKVGDSGSAGRLLMQGALGATGLGVAGGGGAYVGGAEGAQAGTGGALLAAGLLAAGGSKAAQKRLVKVLADRPDALIQAGNQIQRRARYGGIFGAPLLAGGGVALVPQ